VQFRDEQTGQVFAFTDDSGDDEGIFGTGIEVSDILGGLAEGAATGGVLDIDTGLGGAAREGGESVGNWLEDIFGGGGGSQQQPQQPQQPGQGGGIGLPQIPGGGGGGGGIGLPQIPGGGGGGMQPGAGPQLAGGGAGSVDYGRVIGQVGAQLVRYLTSNPQVLSYVAQKLGLRKRNGHASHTDSENMLCAQMLAEQLPDRRRKALRQFLCGLKGPMGNADEYTFMVAMLANMNLPVSYCDCE